MLSKAAQGVLISTKPFKLIYSLATNHTLDNKTYDALSKGLRWGARDLIETSINQATNDNLVSKVLALLITERSVSTTCKNTLRDLYEKQMLSDWKQSCSDLEVQIPFIVSNLLYSVSLDPLFDLLKDFEKSYIENTKTTKEDKICLESFPANTTIAGQIPEE